MTRKLKWWRNWSLNWVGYGTASVVENEVQVHGMAWLGFKSMARTYTRAGV